MERKVMYKDGNKIYNMSKFVFFDLVGQNREGEWIICGFCDCKATYSVWFRFPNELLYKKFIADYLK